MPGEPVVAVDPITRLIHIIRGHRVMLDLDLGRLYGVSTKRLNEQVKRNKARFPNDFTFQLTVEEVGHLKSQFATSSSGWGGRRKLPWVFTEHGAVMLASVLNSPVAVHASIQVVRAFIQLRALTNTYSDLARKLHQLERKYDSQFRVVFDAIRELMLPVDPSDQKQIGFRSYHSG